jgi:hypothetical protein
VIARWRVARWTALAALIAVALLALALIGQLPGQRGGNQSVSAGLQPLIQQAGEPLIVYSEFGHESDTLWAADPGAPGSRSQIAQVKHAPGYGIAPALSPDGAHIAFTALPPGMPGAPDAPAELHVLNIESGETQRIAEGIDLPLPPVWAPDSTSVVVRRSVWEPDAMSGSFEIVRANLDGAQATLASSSDGLFPIGVTPDNVWLYYAALSTDGTVLARAATNGSAVEGVTKLSDGVARDWHLSPDGQQLSYLKEADTGFTTEVIDLGSHTKTAPIGTVETEQFNPIWEPGSASGLTVGILEGSGSVPARVAPDGGGVAGEPLPAGSGFDVPLSWSPTGQTLVVRAFADADIADPGPSRVAVVTTSGERELLSQNSDVFVAGWLEAAP